MTPSTDLVATLIAGPGFRLTQTLLTALARGNRTEWLAQGEAADIFASGEVDAIRRDLLAALGDKPVDVIVQPAASRCKRFLLADMESTIIEQEMLDELADMIGVGDMVASITRRAMNGELDFAASLRERAALLKGQPAKLLDDAAKRITLMPGAEKLLSVMRKNGARAWLVTGGFACFARPVADRLDFNECFANTLVVRDGKITGVVAEPVLDKTAKKESLLSACRTFGLQPEDFLCVGDGGNDVAMLTACNQGGGLGVAFQAKPKVRATVPNQINYGDLTALLYAQGYGEF